jgi:hypothetical protein
MAREAGGEQVSTWPTDQTRRRANDGPDWTGRVEFGPAGFLAEFGAEVGEYGSNSS